MAKHRRKPEKPAVKAPPITPADLPAGWALAELRDVIQPSKEKIDPKRVPDTPYLGLEHIEANSRRIIGQAKGSAAASTKGVFQAGDVLYGKLRPYLNKVCRPTFDGVCSTDILVFPQRPELDSRYLLYFLNRQEVVETTTHVMAGVNLPRVSFETLAELAFPLPPLAEQRRIANRMDDLLQNVETLRSRLARLVEKRKEGEREIPSILKQFRQAVLAAACSGRLTEDWRAEQSSGQTAADVLRAIEDNRAARSVSQCRGKPKKALEVPDGPDVPDGWEIAECARLCQPERALTYGVIKLGPIVPDGVPTLRSSDVRHLLIEDTHVKRISRQIADQYRRTYLRGGELVITVRGTLGGIAVVPPQLAGFNVSREVAVIPLEALLDPRFFAYAIGSEFTQKWLAEVERGVAYTGINIEHLRVLPLPVPPLAEQKEIARRVERLLALGDAVQHRVAKTLQKSAQMTSALFAKAFGGELVPTEAELASSEGRSFESGEQLLQRMETLSTTITSKRPARRPLDQYGRTLDDYVPPETRRVAMRKLNEIQATHLYDILKAAKSGLPPENLLEAAELEVDDFYTQLKREVEAGKVHERRNNKKTVILEAVR